MNAENGKRWLLRLLPLMLLTLIAILAPVLAPWDPWEMTVPFLPPSAEHWLGTNDLGQDIFSELIYGARVSLLVGVISAVVITGFGSAVGAISAWYGGVVDRLIMVLINVGQAIPSLPLIIVLSAFMKRSLANIILCICLTGWVSTARIARARAMQIKEMGFVRNCRTMGGGSLYIVFRHILPNLRDVLLTKGLLSVASAMLTETSVSYLGLGPMNLKSWGAILNDAFRVGGIFNGYWWWYVPPIFCIALTNFCVLSLRGRPDP